MKHIKNFFVIITIFLLQLLCKVSFAGSEIKGTITNCQSCRISVLVDDHGFDLKRDIVPSSPDSYGNFVFDLLNVHTPRVVLLQVNNYTVPVYVEPNRKTGIQINYRGNYFDYSFDRDLTTENNLLKDFNNKYGWVTNHQPGDIFVEKTNTNIKSSLFSKYNQQAQYLRVDYLTKLYSEIRDAVAYMDTPNQQFKQFLTTYANYASGAIVFSLASNDGLLQSHDLGKVSGLSYSISVDESQNDSASFYPYIKANGLIMTKSSNINENNFNEYFNYALLNMQLTSTVKEQYLINLLEKNLNGSNVIPMQSTILDFARQMQNLDNMVHLMDVYSDVKKKANGRKAPNFFLEDRSGRMVSLESLRGKNVFLAFWSSSCRPCIEGMKKSVQNKYYLQGDDIKFVYISTDETKGRWLGNSQLNSAGPNDIHLWAGKGSIDSKEYDAFTLPTYYFINRYGNFIAEFPKSWEPEFVNFVRSRY